MSCQGAVSPQWGRPSCTMPMWSTCTTAALRAFCAVCTKALPSTSFPLRCGRPSGRPPPSTRSRRLPPTPPLPGGYSPALAKKLGAETEYLVSRDFLSGQEDKELLLLRFLHLAFALGPGTVKREGHPVVAPLYAMQKKSGLGGRQISGLCAVRGARRDAGRGHPPQKLYPPPAAPALLRTLPGGGLHDLRCRPSGSAAA